MMLNPAPSYLQAQPARCLIGSLSSQHIPQPASTKVRKRLKLLLASPFQPHVPQVQTDPQ